MSIDPPPYFRVHVFCCTNRRPEANPKGSCAGSGSEELRDYLKARVRQLELEGVRINTAGCLARCELGPVMVIYPEGIWYTYRNKVDIDEILQVHLVGGGRVERLRLPAGAEPPVMTA